MEPIKIDRIKKLSDDDRMKIIELGDYFDKRIIEPVKHLPTGCSVFNLPRKIAGKTSCKEDQR